MRAYQATMANISVSGAITLVQVKPGVASIIITRLKVTQSSTTTSAQQDVAWGTSTGAATVTSFTPKPQAPSAAAQAAYAVGGTTATGVNASGEGSGQTDMCRESFNLLTGWERVFTPEERPEIQGGGAQFFYLRFPAAPSATTFNAEVDFLEVG